MVSPLSLGTAGLGGVYGACDEAASIRTVHRAFELGVNCFDSSPYYGSTRSETILGRALRELPREQLVVMTKCGRYGQADFDFSPARIRDSLERSLERLGLETLDVFFLHDVEFGDLDRILDESLAELLEHKRSGRVRAIGITGLPLRIFRRALELRAPIDAILSYCRLTLLDDALRELLPELAAAGIGVVNGSPTAMGLLSGKGPQDWHPAGAGIRAAARQAAAACAARGRELGALAFQWCAQQAGPATTLCGAVVAEELEQSLQAAMAPIDAALLDFVQSALRPVHRLRWQQGRDENQD